MSKKIAILPQKRYIKQKALETASFLSGRLLAQWICLIVGGCILFTFYLMISRIVSYNADNASILLEAQSMQRGNYLLHGWYLPADSFITLDIPLYALGLQLGFAPTALLRIVPSLLYAVTILCSGYLVSALLPPKQRLWGWLALLGMVAFPTLSMVQSVLIGPIHIGTCLCALLGLLAYKHFLRRGKWFAFALLLFVMILVIIGDPLVFVFLVVPLLLTEGIQMLQKRRWQENPVFFGTILAIVLARIILWIVDSAGVHILSSDNFSFTTLPSMLLNLRQAIIYVYAIFNGNMLTSDVFSLSRLPIFLNALAVSTFVIAIISTVISAIVSRGKLFQAGTTAETKIIQISVWSSLGTVAAFIVSTLGGVAGKRYLFPLLFLSELATFPLIFKFINKHILRIAIVLILVANVIPFGISLLQAPASVSSDLPLIAALKGYHLTQGLGSYWVSASVTVRSEEQVVIRQVVPQGNSIVPDYFLADGSWFDPANLRQANFIAYRNSDDIAAYYTASVHTFGLPDHQYHIKNFTILAWDTPLLTHLQPGASFK